MRIRCPAVFGVSPRSDLWIAFSIACTMAFSQGDTERARILDGDVGDLLQRHLRAVVVDLEVLDQARMRTPGAQLLQVGLECWTRTSACAASRLS